MNFKTLFFKSGITLVVSLLFFIRTSVAQPYQSFPDSNAVWTIGVYDVFGTFYYNYSYRLAAANTDTSITGEHYKKIYFYNSSIVSSYKGALRQDISRKVFYVPKDSLTEKLLYDFSANIGDTVHNVYSDWNVTEPVHNEAILDVDSVYLNGSYHKRLLLPLNFYWIEGIGSIGGLFESTYGGTFSTVYQLDCFTKDSISFYSSSTGNCLTSGTTGYSNTTYCSVSPNPGNGEFILNYNLPGSKKCELQIFNALGMGVYKTIISAEKKEQQIHLANLDDGIYLLTLKNDTYLSSTKLIIKK